MTDKEFEDWCEKVDNFFAWNIALFIVFPIVVAFAVLALM